ncbi:MAG: hypothetical protein WBE91_05125 [Steroidobacteraceae bacterium]
MSTRNVVQHPSASPAAVWPGHAIVSTAGATIAREMLLELAAVPDEGTITVGDLACLENWPRQGRPFRNVVAEYTAMAQSAGTDAVEGFYAVLSDYIGICCQGSIPDLDRYDSLCDTEDTRP